MPPPPLSLEELRCDWEPGARWRSMAMLANLHGCAAIGANVLGLIHVHFPPVYAGTPPLLDLTIDGRWVRTTDVRWAPFEIERRGEHERWSVHTALRLAPGAPGAMLVATITNQSTIGRPLRAAVNSALPVRSYRGQVVGFVPPVDRLTSPNQHFIRQHEAMACTFDVISAGCAAVAALPRPEAIENERWTWNRQLAPGESLRLEFCLCTAEDEGRLYNVQTWAQAFVRHWAASRTELEERWRDAFTPGNPRYAGHLPVPPTDDPALRRVYAASVLDLLLNERSNLWPTGGRSFVLSAPNLGAATQYFWDASLVAPLWARLDEPSLRDLLLAALGVDWRQSYAIDQQSGVALGVWHALNAWALVRMARECLRFAPDGLGLLDNVVRGRRVGELLEEVAWSWREGMDAETGLAHGGGRWNLLECIDGYEHCVPSLNAGAIAMMRDVATMLDRWRGLGAGNDLRSAASAHVSRVLALYAGDGWWAGVRDDGRRVVVRTVVDLLMIEQSLGDELPAGILEDMLAAVRRELLAGNWMLAQSPEDPEAIAQARSGDPGRPDHGWTGASPAWLAQTVGMLARRGAREEALTRLRLVADVARRQGPFGHAILVEGEPGDETKIITFAALPGAAIAQTMIEDLWPQPVG